MRLRNCELMMAVCLVFLICLSFAVFAYHFSRVFQPSTRRFKKLIIDRSVEGDILSALPMPRTPCQIGKGLDPSASRSGHFRSKAEPFGALNNSWWLHSQLVGIVTGSPKKARQWQEKYGIDEKNTYNYRDFDRLAENSDIDVIYIVLPNSMHQEFTIRAARAGKHVLCEKPMSVSSHECRTMIRACEEANVKLAIGYRCQFEPHHLECMRVAREEEFGRLRYIDAGFGFRFGDYPVGDLRRWRLEHELAGGGALMDVGIYALQACRYLAASEPISVMAREIKTDHTKFAEVDETILWSMEFPRGVLANCSTTYGFGGVNFATAYADKGSFGLKPAFGYGGIQAFAGQRSIDRPDIDQFAKEIDDFSNVIQTDGKSKVSGEEGLKDMLVMEAIYESVRIGGKVDVAAI